MHSNTRDRGARALDAGNVVEYLQSRGVIEPGPADVELLGGGVSNLVLAVRTHAGRVVVKQALARLRVVEDWFADPERVLAEARALQIAFDVSPGAVPRVLDVDADRNVITIEAAPDAWRAWTSVLLAGEADPLVAERLGTLLASWHTATSGGDLDLDEWALFEQLRIDPYYREVARRHPDIAATILGYADAMSRRRSCLVHGDFSPKNVLVGDAALWVIDFEVAHLGDPAFDVAFLLSHLMLKAVALPQREAAFLACARAFDETYRSGISPLAAPRHAYVLGHVGCLMLARVDGKSPVEYLDNAGRRRTRALARRLIAAPPSSLAGLTALLAGSA